MIQHFMTPAPVTVNEGLMLSDALDRMYSNQIHHMPVVHPEHGVVGTISDHDISAASSLRGLNPDETPVRQAMAPTSYTCDLFCPLVDVVHHMERERLSSVVVTKGDRPVGIFTTTDALRALRSKLVGYRVEPAVTPAQAASQAEPAASSTTRHPIQPSVRVTRNHGTLPAFCASL